MLQTVAEHTARQFARAIIMPNLNPPVTQVAAARAYRERILAAVPAGLGFQPLMTCYLTDGADPAELLRGHREGVWVAAKLYPAHATTNSAHGVTSVDKIAAALEAMERAGMPLLVHGEVTDPEVDIFDREAVFLDRVLAPLLKRHQGLKVVLEHITTAEGVAFVEANSPRVGGTITPHHLSYNRNAIFLGGRIFIACRSPSARCIGWRCAGPRPRAMPASFWAPIPRRTASTPRNAPAAAPAFSTLRWRCRSMPRFLPRRGRSIGWKRLLP